MMVSLDGFVAGPGDDLEWTASDDEINRFSLEQIRNFDTVLLGRRAYQLFESYWPTAPQDPSTNHFDLEIARLINEVEKVVFSKSLDEVGWNNSRILREVVPEELEELKQRPGKDMVIYGGANIAQAFMEQDLIDEYRLLVHPLVLSEGKMLFQNIHQRLPLKLKETTVFNSGVVVLDYERA
jgi:dihydrofolate reductase